MSSHALSTTRVPVSFVMGSAITLAVLGAVSGWKYSPRVSDGVAVDRPGMRVVLKFHLED